MIIGVLSLGVKRPGRGADHSLPPNAEFKNAWSYTSTPQYASMARFSVKRRRSFPTMETDRNKRRYNLSFKNTAWKGLNKVMYETSS
jgi:hypothetical protein